MIHTPKYLNFHNGQKPLRVDNLVQWQLIDEDTGAVFPWFTHPFLHVLKDWDLSNKRVLEFGGGRSTRWWRTKAKWVTTIDTNVQWSDDIERDCEGLDNGVLVRLPINEGDQSRSQEYVNAGDQYGPYDIVIVDGILRYECLVKALSMKRPLTVIADNWNQAFVWISPPSVELMAPFEIHSFEQPGHTDNDGVNKWKTVYWELKSGCVINYWNCKFSDYVEAFDGEEETRYYNCTCPKGNGSCDKNNKYGDEKDYCEIAEVE